MSVIIYHNPKCSTSRKVLDYLRNAGVEPQIIEYLKDPPSKAKLTELLREMEIGARDLLRTKEPLYKELGLNAKDSTDAQALDAMVERPVLIERPIVVSDHGAILCRPPERVYEVLPGKGP